MTSLTNKYMYHQEDGSIAYARNKHPEFHDDGSFRKYFFVEEENDEEEIDFLKEYDEDYELWHYVKYGV